MGTGSGTATVCLVDPSHNGSCNPKSPGSQPRLGVGSCESFHGLSPILTSLPVDLRSSAGDGFPDNEPQSRNRPRSGSIVLWPSSPDRPCDGTSCRTSAGRYWLTGG